MLNYTKNHLYLTTFEIFVVWDLFLWHYCNQSESKIYLSFGRDQISHYMVKFM